MPGGACVKKFRNCELAGRMALWYQLEEALLSPELAPVREDLDLRMLAKLEEPMISAVEKATGDLMGMLEEIVKRPVAGIEGEG